MPKIDGIELMKIARQKFKGTSFPIIAISGTAVEQMDDLAGAGADRYIAKGPLDEMTEQINALMDLIENGGSFLYGR